MCERKQSHKHNSHWWYEEWIFFVWIWEFVVCMCEIKLLCRLFFELFFFSTYLWKVYTNSIELVCWFYCNLQSCLPSFSFVLLFVSVTIDLRDFHFYKKTFALFRNSNLAYIAEKPSMCVCFYRLFYVSNVYWLS